LLNDVITAQNTYRQAIIIIIIIIIIITIIKVDISKASLYTDR